MGTDEVRVRILGPVGSETADGEVSLGPRLRQLLGRLAVAEGVVTDGELVEAMWLDAESLPANPSRSLQTYVSRLRADLGSSAIERLTSGYQLVRSRLWIDADVAEELMRESSQAVDRGDDRTAIELLDQALGLWRGATLGDLGGEPWGVAEAGRLDELRLDGRERRAELLLGLGDVSGALVADLEAMAVEHPLRARPTRLLMLALYSSGRQADALAAFARHRRQLATDLGLDPSEDLRQLEEQILTDDPAVKNLGRARPLRGYQIVERLGEGAFSIVHRGTQESVGREVAIKQIRAELANRPEFIRRFETEAHLVARLEHPHIVPLIDYWREPNSAYLVMRLLGAGSLEANLRSGPWELERVVEMVTQVGGALSTAHRAGVVHRDVKPANILLDSDQNAYLTDFGIALEASEAADPEAALSIGSPVYASPEQLRRQPVGPPADIHGLAITAYEALTARVPFPDEPNQAALLQRQLNDPIPLLRDSRSDIPAAVDDVLARATAKDPGRRHQTVDEFVAELHQAVIGDGSGPEAPSRPGGGGHGRVRAGPESLQGSAGLR